MRSGVVREEIGGRQNLDEITHVKSHLNQKYDNKPKIRTITMLSDSI